MKIVVLSGGLSPERDVSKKSSSLIANALLSKGHKVAVVDLYEGIGEDVEIESVFREGQDDLFSYTIPEEEPDLEALIQSFGGRREWLGPRVIEICKIADSVFLGLHGSYGENGQLQAVLDANNIAYTGSGYLGCALAMDKDISKAIIASRGIKTAKWMIKPAEDIVIDEIKETIGIPCVVKPIGCGSSCGVSIVKNDDEFNKAISYAASYKQDVLIEAFITGREITVGVVNDEALPIIEIIPHEGFYDYKNKYQAGLTDHICPANFTPDQTKRAQDLAVEIFKALRMKAYGRIDMIYDEKEDDFWFIEANNLPGMTNTSLVPDAAKVAGISYEDLCDRIARSCGKERI
ncbi:MAG: D-alanine--D-alanine ligase [Clostridiales bacterium]|nr:D-alanine--D-alanine ligase [Clostridiales bacterium]